MKKESVFKNVLVAEAALLAAVVLIKQMVEEIEKRSRQIIVSLGIINLRISGS